MKAAAPATGWLRFFARVTFVLFGYIPAHFTFRQRLRRVLGASAFGSLWDTFQFILTLAACASYVWSTYSSESGVGVPMEWVFMASFSADYAMRWIASVIGITW